MAKLQNRNTGGRGEGRSRKPLEKKGGRGERGASREERPDKRKSSFDSSRGERDRPTIKKGRPAGDRSERVFNGKSEGRPKRSASFEEKKSFGGKTSFDKKPFKKNDRPSSARPFHKKRRDDGGEAENKPRFRKSHRDLDSDFSPRGGYMSRTERDGLVRLNKFLSQAGIASRRDADELIALGLISVNGKVITELGEKINPQKDVVKYDDRVIRPEQFRYVLLNKPKGFLTTQEDPGGRETVMDLVRSACKERIYPVGRMEKDAMGLLLFTNDGDMAKRLTHPKHDYPKLYHVELSERISQKDLNRLLEGVQLEDGFVQADQIAFVEGSKDGKQVGIRLNSGKSNVVKRMFEHLGFRIKKLDRVMFAGLNKKDLTRGRYRHLTEKEIGFLKMIR